MLPLDILHARGSSHEVFAVVARKGTHFAHMVLYDLPIPEGFSGIDEGTRILRIVYPSDHSVQRERGQFST